MPSLPPLTHPPTHPPTHPNRRSHHLETLNHNNAHRVLSTTQVSPTHPPTHLLPPPPTHPPTSHSSINHPPTHPPTHPPHSSINSPPSALSTSTRCKSSRASDVSTSPPPTHPPTPTHPPYPVAQSNLHRLVAHSNPHLLPPPPPPPIPICAAAHSNHLLFLFPTHPPTHPLSLQGKAKSKRLGSRSSKSSIPS